jgi:hypothetical protein
MAFLFLSLLIPLLVNRLITQREKLEKEEEQAENDLLKLQQSLATAVGRLSRIRKIRRRIKERIDESVRRGLSGQIEELGDNKAEGEAMPPSQVLPALDSHEFWVENDLRYLGLPDNPD